MKIRVMVIAMLGMGYAVNMQGMRPVRMVAVGQPAWQYEIMRANVLESFDAPEKSRKRKLVTINGKEGIIEVADDIEESEELVKIKKAKKLRETAVEDIEYLISQGQDLHFVVANQYEKLGNIALKFEDYKKAKDYYEAAIKAYERSYVNNPQRRFLANPSIRRLKEDLSMIGDYMLVPVR